MYVYTPHGCKQNIILVGLEDNDRQATFISTYYVQGTLLDGTKDKRTDGTPSL